jgi:hypothetical protein
VFLSFIFAHSKDNLIHFSNGRENTPKMSHWVQDISHSPTSPSLKDVTSAYKDPLDAGGNDRQVVAEQLKAYKDTLIFKHDDNLGVEENEAVFQATMARWACRERRWKSIEWLTLQIWTKFPRFCEYLEPEFDDAVAKEHERQMEDYDEEELLERKWIPADEFGEKGGLATLYLS